MTYAFSLADVAFLASAAGRDAVATVAAAVSPQEHDRLRAVAVARATAGPERAGAVLETVLLQARARGRVPAGWLLSADALEQATAAPVAAHRAARLRGCDVHDVTCSVGAELAALHARADGARTLGSDLDPVRLAMARANVPGAALARADALAPASRGAVLVADPGRRSGTGRRVWRPEAFTPPLGALADAAAGRDLVVSTAPGLDPALVGWAREVELVSLDGGVREAALWSAGLVAPDGPRRRATVLSSSHPAWEVTDLDDDTCPVRPAGEWIVDPEGAVVRAGLVRHWGARHGLGRLEAHLAYLTGDRRPPGVRAFRVLEEGRYSEKALRAALRARQVGRVEILVRGLDVDPDRLRPALRPSGPHAATVVLARLATGPRAYVCEAVAADAADGIGPGPGRADPRHGEPPAGPRVDAGRA